MPQTKSPNIPTITSPAQLGELMQSWKASLNRLVKTAVPAPPPLNFAATQARGGIQLTWSPTSSNLSKNNVLGEGVAQTKPDGYELLVSKSGDFVSDVEVYSFHDVTQTTFFYPTPGGPTKLHFKIHSTSGTPINAQTVFGPDSGTIHHTSLDSTDTTTKATSVRDNYTSDQTRSLARVGRYPSQYLATYAQRK